MDDTECKVSEDEIMKQSEMEDQEIEIVEEEE